MTPSSQERISVRIVEQIVDFTVSGRGLQDYRPGQSSSSSSHFPAGVHEVLDEHGEGFFRTFPSGKKVRVSPRVRVRGCPGTSAHGLRRLVTRPSVPTSGCSSRGGGQTLLLEPTLQRDLGVKVVWFGEQPAAGGVGTGTRKRVSVLMTSHRFLLADGSRSEGLGITSPLLGCHFWQSCSVQCSAWSVCGYSSCVSLRWLWWLFHTFSCEGGPRILRLILGRSHGFPMSPSCSVSLPCEVFKCRTQARTERARAVRHETLHRICAAVSVKNKCWRLFLALSSFGMFFRHRFRSGCLRGERRGTDVAFCVVGGEVVFERSFAYFFGGFLFYLFVCLFLCFPVYVSYCLRQAETILLRRRFCIWMCLLI